MIFLFILLCSSAFSSSFWFLFWQYLSVKMYTRMTFGGVSCICPSQSNVSHEPLAKKKKPKHAAFKSPQAQTAEF